MEYQKPKRETIDKQKIVFPNWNPQKKTISMLSNISERIRYKALRNSSSAFIKRKDVRDVVFERDKYKCQICGSSEQLEVDHINSVYSVLKDKYPMSKLNTLENLRTLCKSCNSRKAP